MKTSRALFSTLARFSGARSALLLAGLLAMVVPARAEVYVTNLNAGTVGVYNNDGTTINANFITGLDHPYGITLANSSIYIAQQTLGGTIAQYNLDGSVANATLITGLYNPSYTLVTGSFIYVAVTTDGVQGTGVVGKYNLDGSVVDANFITGLNSPRGMALSGSNLYVVNQGNATIDGSVGLYSAITGLASNTSLISGLHNAEAAVISGSSLYVSHDNFPSAGGSVDEFDLSGNPITVPLINDNIYQLVDLALLSGNVYITLPGAGTFGEYNLTTGNAMLFGPPLASPFGIAVSPQSAVPEPSTWALLAGGASLLVVYARRRLNRARA